MLPAKFDQYQYASKIVEAPQLNAHVNPFRFSHRIAIYKHLIQTTNYNNQFGADNAMNPLWGLLLQLLWQDRSRRLGTHFFSDIDAINPNAPWGYGNFLLCIVPLIAAVDVNIIDSVQLEAPKEKTNHKYIWHKKNGELHFPKEFESARESWRKYFIATQEKKFDSNSLQEKLWDAHKSCIDIFTQNFDLSENTYYSHNEIHFIRGWCRTMDFLWKAAWPTNFDFMLLNGINVLPERLLNKNDNDRSFKDLDSDIRRNIRNILRVADHSDRMHKIQLWLWSRIMRSNEAREKVTILLENMFDPRLNTFSNKKELLRYFLRK